MAHLCNACAKDDLARQHRGETVFIRYERMPIEIVLGKHRGRGRPPKGAPPNPFNDPALEQISSRMMEAEDSERIHYQGGEESTESAGTNGRRRGREIFEIEGEEVDAGGVPGEGEDSQGGG